MRKKYLFCLITQNDGEPFSVDKLLHQTFYNIFLHSAHCIDSIRLSIVDCYLLQTRMKKLSVSTFLATNGQYIHILSNQNVCNGKLQFLQTAENCLKYQEYEYRKCDLLDN